VICQISVDCLMEVVLNCPQTQWGLGPSQLSHLVGLFCLFVCLFFFFFPMEPRLVMVVLNMQVVPLDKLNSYPEM